jgi:tellurite methyltransferase
VERGVAVEKSLAAENGVTVKKGLAAERGVAVEKDVAAERGMDGERGIELKTVAADLNDYSFSDRVDLIYSCGALQYIRPERRADRFACMKAVTKQGGLHVLFAFVEQPDAPKSHDWGQNEFFYTGEELLGYYLDWEILHSYEYRFSCRSGGVPHVHAARVLAARKALLDRL